MESITIDKGAESPDALFNASTRLDVITHVPSVNVNKLQLETLADSTYVHVTVVAPLVAVMVTVSPSLTPEDRTAGVVSFVTLSVEEEPVSDDEIRLGVFGAAIAETTAESTALVLRLRTSCTEYVAVAVPVKPLDGVKVATPVDASTCQTPWPTTVILDSVQVGAVSPAPQRYKELAVIPVPVSLSSGDRVMSLVTTPDAESA